MIGVVEESKFLKVPCPVPKMEMDRIAVKEAFAKLVKETKEEQFSIDMTEWVQKMGVESLRDAAEGILLAFYEPARYPAKPKTERKVELCLKKERAIAEQILKETHQVVKGSVSPEI